MQRTLREWGDIPLWADQARHHKSAEDATFGEVKVSSQEASNQRTGCRLEKRVSIFYAAIAVLILLAVYLVRGPRYALGTLLVLVTLYAAFVWLVSASMS